MTSARARVHATSYTIETAPETRFDDRPADPPLAEMKECRRGQDVEERRRRVGDPTGVEQGKDPVEHVEKVVRSDGRPIDANSLRVRLEVGRGVQSDRAVDATQDLGQHLRARALPLRTDDVDGFERLLGATEAVQEKADSAETSIDARTGARGSLVIRVALEVRNRLGECGERVRVHVTIEFPGPSGRGL